MFSGSQDIYLWKSKEMSKESIKNSPGSDDTFGRNLIDYR